MTSKLGCGFVYDLTVADKKTGAVRAQYLGEKNRVPLEGLNDIAAAYLKGGAGPGALYIGLWSGARIPDGLDTVVPVEDCTVLARDGEGRPTSIALSRISVAMIRASHSRPAASTACSRSSTK